MKKQALILLISLAAFALTSCNNEPGQKMIVKTRDLTVPKGDWKFDANTMQYYYNFNMPEITPYAYNYGTWTVNLEYNYGKPNAFQTPLPFSLPAYEEEIDPLTGDTSLWYYTQHIDYLVGVEFLEIQLTNSDFIYPAQKPDTMHFRFQLIY